MKKILLCILLAAAMLIQPLSITTFADTEMYGTDTVQRAVSLLNGLGILDSADNDLQTGVSRSRFAIYTARFIGMDGAAFSAEPYFTDITANDEGYSEVNTLAQLNIISVNDDKLYNPQKLITYNEALKMLTCAMGYSAYAQNSGGYPNGYVIVANKLKLLNDVSISDGSFNTEQAAVLLYNALFTNISDSYIADGKYVSDVRKNINFLNSYFNVYEAEGTVNATSVTSIDGNGSLSEGKVRIGSDVYLTGNSKIDDYIGSNVVFYYKANARKTIVSFYAESDGKIIELNAADICGYKNRKYTYEVAENNKKTKEAEISASANIFLNKCFVSYDESVMIPKCGRVRLVESDNDRKYALVFITSYENVVVDSVNVTDGIINAKYGMPSIDLNINKPDTVVKIFDTDNFEYDIRDLGEWDVLSCTATPDKSRTDIVLVRDYVNGTINTINTKDNSLTIGRRNYELSEYFPKSGVYALSVGTTGDFLLDIDGKIAAFVPVDGSQYSMGYLMGIDKKGGVSSDVLIKLFTENNKAEEFYLADKITLDGTKSTSANSAEVFAALGSGKLIRYSVNKNGKICVIDTADTAGSISEENALFVSSDKRDIKLRYNQFCGYIVMDSATKVFIVPDDITDEDAFLFKNYTFFAHDTEYSVEGYSVSNDGVCSDAVVCYRNNGDGVEKKYNYDCSIIDSISFANDENGELVEQVTLWTRGTKKVVNSFDSKYVSETLGLGEGDIIRYGTANGDKINDIDVLYDYDPKTNTGEYKYKKYKIHESVNNEYRVMPCWIYRRDGNSIAITDKDLSVITDEEAANLTMDDIEVYLLNQAKIMVYDHSGRSDKITAATASELNDYLHSGSQSSFVILQMRSGIVRSVIAYK